MYSKTHWQDRVVDPETGEVVQEGTFMSAEHFNNMEDGIEANDAAISEISESVETIETTLDKDVGTTIALTVNSSTFVMKLALKNSEGDILSESEVDLPIESMIVNAEYVEATKSLVLTLQSGSKVTVPLSALINGLVNDTRKVAGMDLKKDITVAEMVTALGVDKKANKTSVSSGENSTTSVINVTDAKAQMAMIASIKGKTYKKNLLPLKKFAASTEVNKVTLVPTYDGDKLLYITISGTATGGDADFDLTDGFTVQFVNGKSYILNGCPAGGSESKYRLLVQDSAYAANAIDYGTGSTFIANANKFRATIRIKEGQTVNLKFYPMVRESTVTNGEYVPYGTLQNAPVESVVSQGKNLFDKATVQRGTINSSGTFNPSTSGDIYTSDYIEVKPNAAYYFKDCISIYYARTVGMYDASKNYLGEVHFAGAETHASGSLTTVANTKYIRVAIYSTYKDAVMVTEGSSAPTTYTPYNKTTVLVPQSIRNLPDYGCSTTSNYGNTLDLENGTYEHLVRCADMGGFTWGQYDGTKKIWYASIGARATTMTLSKYNAVTTAPADLNDKEITVYTNGALYLRDTSFTSAADAQAKLAGTKICYALGTSETLSVSDYIRPLPVEQGGTLTLVNEHNLDVNSTIKYKKEV